jgi:hypothetical protein
MDVDVQKDVADKRRSKNHNAAKKFASKSDIVRLNIHYLVPRVDEKSSWLIDETVDDFYTHDLVKEIIPVMQAFPDAVLLDNGLPGWHQK